MDRTHTTDPPAAAASANGAAPSADGGHHSEQATVAPPLRLRQRRVMPALGVALIVVGGLLAAGVATMLGDTKPVLAVSSDITRGTVIEASDLTVTDMVPAPPLDPVPANRRAEIVGQRAAMDLPAGTLLTADSVTNKVIPAAGHSLVAVAVQSGRLPAQALQPGDPVRVVNTPPEHGTPPKKAPKSIRATVVDAHRLPNTDGVVVNVTVPADKASLLAARAATGRIAIVLDNPARHAGDG